MAFKAFGNKASGIVHDVSCPFHPSEENLILFEEFYHALQEGFVECTYCCTHTGPYWKQENFCFNCEVGCTLWDSCEFRYWKNDQAICGRPEMKPGSKLKIKQ